MRRRALLAGVLAAPVVARAADAWTPDRPIRLIVPFAAGGSTDVTGRQLAQALGERLGQPVVAENRPGAGGNIAAEVCAHAAPDGYSIMIATSGMLAANQALYKVLPFDPLRDLAPVAQVAMVPNLIVVNRDLPVRDLASLIAYAKARPGQVFYGSAGSGTSLHLAGAMFAVRAGIEIVHVPYRGGAPAATDLMAGKIQMIASPMVEVLAAVQSGTLRPLAVTTRHRSPVLPDVPTVAETLPGFEIALWSGIVAPAATPPAAIARIASEIGTVLRSGPLPAKLAEQGSEAAPSTPDEFATLIRAEIPRWTEIVRLSGATAD